LKVSDKDEPEAREFLAAICCQGGCGDDIGEEGLHHGSEGRIGEFIRVHGVCISHRECSLSHLNLIPFLLFLISPNSMLAGKYFNSTEDLV
jgi:hypothetical protein